ncbi:MAG: endonuclease/exonuclease/phosphatase family protein [Anaerolineales bacterium]|nr:endonuclease/exonuclease/phosphatase family protein [Anaerolineales bacterium]
MLNNSKLGYHLLDGLAFIYLVALLSWFILYQLSGDRFAYVSLFTMLAIYAFIPLPFAIAWGIRQRQIPLLTLAALNGGVFWVLWGQAFSPKFSQPIQSELVVLPYNVLGWNEEVGSQVEIIRQMDADVVFLQELNPELAASLETQLADQYPSRALDAQVGVNGMGTLSKFPLRSAGKVPQLGWVGEPQWLRLEWQNCAIYLMNIHMSPTNFLNAEHINQTNALRQSQAQWIRDQIAPGRPFIVAGDTNSVPLSDSYRILRQKLEDAWQVSGWGLGHTFPGSDGPGSSRPQFFGVSVPQWLLRIDYIFYTSHFRATHAGLADFDGVSDHRGVWARLGWTGNCDAAQP